MTEQLHIAFVWHMHQPYYRAAGSEAFSLPWVRMHALKDYLDMVEMLDAFPALHQTFNLVPSLVEQLEDYAAGDFVDLYWQHTLKPATELDPAERLFVVERLCEHPDHPRARLHPRYQELARKRQAQAAYGWEACAPAFSTGELRDLQVWFNLAWFDPAVIESTPLSGLVQRGRDFTEDDKRLLAEVQTDLLDRTLPAYRAAVEKGQIEVSTSPYFHPILPLLANSDSARVSAAEQILPPRRFAYPEDAAEHIRAGVAKHTQVFGRPPQGMWCSEQAVGEDVIPLLLASGLKWTISDETVLSRSLASVAEPAFVASEESWGLAPGRTGSPCNPPGCVPRSGEGTPTGAAPEALTPHDLYTAYRLERDAGEMAVVFRDHTLSDLIGFTYQSWAARDAAADLIHRLRDIHAALRADPSGPGGIPLVTIALDGENAWEYYPRDGRDFLLRLYEGLSAEPAFRCVTISEHLRESPPSRSLSWLHTGSWIGGDLRTWSGDRAHNRAWELLHNARDLVASRRKADAATQVSRQAEAAWRHILITEGSDWFWWFGDHRHTELDYVWDRDFRRHLQEVYRILGEPVPERLFLPILEQAPLVRPSRPLGELDPVIDGVIGDGPGGDSSEWDSAGFLASDLPSTMQCSGGAQVHAVRFGWSRGRLCLLVIPASPENLPGLEIEVRLTEAEKREALVVTIALAKEEGAAACSPQCSGAQSAIEVSWKEVAEISFDPLSLRPEASDYTGLVVRVGRRGLVDHVFHTAGLDSLGWAPR